MDLLENYCGIQVIDIPIDVVLCQQWQRTSSTLVMYDKIRDKADRVGPSEPAGPWLPKVSWFNDWFTSLVPAMQVLVLYINFRNLNSFFKIFNGRMTICMAWSLAFLGKVWQLSTPDQGIFENLIDDLAEQTWYCPHWFETKDIGCLAWSHGWQLRNCIIFHYRS